MPEDEPWYDAWVTRSNAILVLIVGIVGAVAGAAHFFSDQLQPKGADIVLSFESMNETTATICSKANPQAGSGT